MRKELNSRKEHQVAELVPAFSVPAGVKAIGSRWLYKVKPDGIFKGRVIVQGYRQQRGIDCGGTFAPVYRTSSQRVLSCLAASKGFHVQHLDVKTAFLNAPVEEDVYVKQAPGYEELDPETGQPLIMKLQKSLYGLPRSPRNWGTYFAGAIKDIGFSAIRSDPCVYTYGSRKSYIVLSVHVHDVLLLGQTPFTVEKMKGQLMARFSMSDLGTASLVLGT